jgi:hypothetical protein
LFLARSSATNKLRTTSLGSAQPVLPPSGPHAALRTTASACDFPYLSTDPPCPARDRLETRSSRSPSPEHVDTSAALPRSPCLRRRARANDIDDGPFPTPNHLAHEAAEREWGDTCRHHRRQISISIGIDRVDNVLLTPWGSSSHLSGSGRQLAGRKQGAESWTCIPCIPCAELRYVRWEKNRMSAPTCLQSLRLRKE